MTPHRLHSMQLSPSSDISRQQNLRLNHQPVEQYPSLTSDSQPVMIDMRAELTPIPMPGMSSFNGQRTD